MYIWENGRAETGGAEGGGCGRRLWEEAVRGGCVVERLTVGQRTRLWIHLLPFQNLGNFVHPKLPISFGTDNKSRCSLLPGDYARGSKRPHDRGKWNFIKGKGKCMFLYSAVSGP